MGNVLMLEIPDEVFKPLAKKAEKEGRRPEDVAAEWLRAAVQREIDDPLLQLAGTLEADVSDISEKHDAYIAETLSGETRGRDHA